MTKAISLPRADVPKLIEALQESCKVERHRGGRKKDRSAPESHTYAVETAKRLESMLTTLFAAAVKRTLEEEPVDFKEFMEEVQNIKNSVTALVLRIVSEVEQDFCRIGYKTGRIRGV
jgi:hypothetical protein